DHRAHRHPDLDVLAAAPEALLAHAVLAALGAEHPLVAEVHQRIEVLVGHQPDAAAVAAVASVRSSHGHELLPPEAHAAVAAVAGDDADFGFVDEFHGGKSREWGMGNGEGVGYAGVGDTGSMMHQCAGRVGGTWACTSLLPIP